MSSGRRASKVLFLTPFNFSDAANDDRFDALIEAQLHTTPGVHVVADHVEPFDADEEGYEAAQAEAVLESLRQVKPQDFDSVVIACHYDPALAESRAAVSVPVIGPLQMTTSFARQYGQKFAVLTDVAEAEPVITELVQSYGHSAACTGVTAIGLDGDTILSDTLTAARRVDELVQEIANDGEAQSVVIGCTIVSAAYEQHRQEFPDRGISVLNSNLLTVQGASILS